MSRFPSRPAQAGLALAALSLCLACQQIQTGGAVCRANGRELVEQDAVYWSREWAFDKVNFDFCRNAKCSITIDAGTECDLPDTRDCIARHVGAANGLVVEQEADATVRLTCLVTKVYYSKQAHYASPDIEVGTFEGRLTVTEAGLGGAKRTFKLRGYSRKGF